MKGELGKKCKGRVSEKVRIKGRILRKGGSRKVRLRTRGKKVGKRDRIVNIKKKKGKKMEKMMDYLEGKFNSVEEGLRIKRVEKEERLEEGKKRDEIEKELRGKIENLERDVWGLNEGLKKERNRRREAEEKGKAEKKEIKVELEGLKEEIRKMIEEKEKDRIIRGEEKRERDEKYKYNVEERKKNIVVRGVEATDDNWRDIIKEVLKKAGIGNVDREMRRIGNRDKTGRISVLVKLRDEREKEGALKKAKNWSRIGRHEWLDEDMTPAERSATLAVRKIANELIREGRGIRCERDRLWVDEKEWRWNEKEKSLIDENGDKWGEVEKEGENESENESENE